MTIPKVGSQITGLPSLPNRPRRPLKHRLTSAYQTSAKIDRNFSRCFDRAIDSSVRIIWPPTRHRRRHTFLFVLHSLSPVSQFRFADPAVRKVFVHSGVEVGWGEFDW